MVAAIYSRKSKFSDKGESVGNQIQMCKDYLERNYPGIEDIKIYEDEGFSGKDVNRPEFKKMMKHAKSKKFSILICYRLDRISRNVADFSNTITELQKFKIDFVSIKEQFDTSSPMGRAMMNIAAVFAQLERETIAERIKDNMLELAKTGRWLGGTSPIGYASESISYKNNDGKEKKMFKLVQVEEEIPLVKLIFKLYLEKRGLPSVATYLCKNKYKGKNGGEFSRETVKQIITNPVYCISDERIFDYFKKQNATICDKPDNIHGLMVYNKREGGKKNNPIDKWIISNGKHEGIITSDTWLKCQEIMNYNNSKSSPRTGTGKKFLLSSMIICGECGSGMASWSHYNKKREFMERYYRCNLKNRASNRCSNKMLNAYRAEEYVIKNLKQMDLKHYLKIYAKNKEVSIDIEKVKTEQEILNKKILDNKKVIQGLIRKMALLDDDIEIIKMLTSEINTIKKENDEIKEELSKLNLMLEDTKEEDTYLGELKDNFFKFQNLFDSSNIEQQRILIKTLVKNIVWYSKEDKLVINLVGSNPQLPDAAVKRRF